ncbi:hypothetical protein PV328_003970 [Microctonus aethiopoides]|uniref:Uncharacterized protein n=1 Tax=Microctonus aethiopoides TaxID=144406 RepID=A0AA39KL82_9HYME|nr:hypothetical protein PV328_003970 [Microctonus aethiopoides]
MWGSCFTPHTRNPYLGRGPKESSENTIKEARTFEWKKPPKTNTKKERQSQNVQNKYIQQKHHYTQSTNSSSMKEIELSWIRASSITSSIGIHASDLLCIRSLYRLFIDAINKSISSYSCISFAIANPYYRNSDRVRDSSSPNGDEGWIDEAIETSDCVFNLIFDGMALGIYLDFGIIDKQMDLD